MGSSLRLHAVFLVVVALGLIGAHDGVSVDDLIRQANDAAERGETEAAEHLYSRAEERAADPGLVAFNKGTVLYRRGEARAAELCFRRVLGDAEISLERLARSFYNLGICLVRQAQATDVKQLQDAVDCFETAIREATDDGLRQDAAHNLEVAKLILIKARASRPANERDPDFENPDNKQPPSPPKTDDGASDGGVADADGKRPEPSSKMDASKGRDPGNAPKETPKSLPGKGSLPVVPDTDEVKPLSAEDARDVLQNATSRIRRERQKLREEAAQGDRPRANDW